MTGPFTGTERREIAGRARTLHERLSGPENESGGDPPFDPDEVIEAWRDAFPDEGTFDDRLAHEDISEAAVREQVAATRWPADEPLPSWIDDLESVVAHVEQVGTGGTVAVGESDDGRPSIPEDLPFADLLAPVAGFACERLPDGVPVDAVEPMVVGLAERLRMLARQALFVEFKSFLTHHDPELAHADPGEVEDPPTDYYEAFVDAMIDGGVRNLCLEYPVLARQLVDVVTNWRDAVAETWQRLESDRDALAERFGVEGSVTALDPLARETHARGRVPVRVTFESGSVVYKPRPVDAGVVLYEVLDLLAGHLPWAFRRPGYLPREGYGWMEEVQYRDPEDVAGVERFYERGGALLCLAYLLRMNDCQFENLIVDGGQPTILDAETVFRPSLSASETPMPAGVHLSMDGSVLLTGFPPFGVGNPADSDGETRRPPTAGFGDGVGEIGLGHRARPVIVAPNTDVMDVEEQVPKIDRTDNVPTVDGEDHTPDGYVEEIVAGFERTYEAACELHADGRFDPILDRAVGEGIETRLVYRATNRYGDVLRATDGKDVLRDGARLTVEFEALATPFFDGNLTERHWPLYAAERRSLRRRDVPRFAITPGETEIAHDGGPLGVELETAGIESVRGRLDAMDDRDRRRQAWLLRRCYDPLGEPSMDVTPVDPTDDLLTETAVELGDDVIDAAFETGSGREWISLSSGGDESTLKVVPVGESLYDGRSGIGLALAALAATTGRERFRRVAVETFDDAVEALERGSAASTLGGTSGLGSAVYALTVAGDLLDERRYVRAAADLTGRITDERLAADDTLDVTRGSAGTLLALLAHHERHGDRAILDRAIACGDRLLEAREPVDGHRVWVTIDDVPTLGFAHGTSGIAYALARLAAATDDDRYATAAREALAYEDALYAADRRNWPRRDSNEFAYVDQWCYGRAGVALARAGIGVYLEDRSLLAEAARHVEVTRAEGFEEHDKLCCGNFGKGMTILETARRTDGDPDDAARFLGRCLARRRRDGSFAIPGHSASVTDPTFFRGVSGIAYSLLRLRDPDRLPCVLLLE